MIGLLADAYLGVKLTRRAQLGLVCVCLFVAPNAAGALLPAAPIR